MADNLRNEVQIELAGETRTMRATFAAIRGIEADTGRSIIATINRLGDQGDLSVTDSAIIIFHGLRGFGDTRLDRDAVGEAVLAAGLNKVGTPVVEFLTGTLNGVSLGKPQETEASQ